MKCYMVFQGDQRKVLKQIGFFLNQRHFPFSTIYRVFLADNCFVKILKNMRTLIKTRRAFKIKILLGSFNLDNGQPADGIILFSVYLGEKPHYFEVKRLRFYGNRDLVGEGWVRWGRAWGEGANYLSKGNNSCRLDEKYRLGLFS